MIMHFYSTAVANDTELSDPQFYLLFPIGHLGTTNCIDILITSDTELEDDHDFNVTIIDAGSPPHARVLMPTVATVIITDDESKHSFSLFLNSSASVLYICFSMIFTALCSLLLAGALVTLAPIVEVIEGEYIEVCVDLICTGSALGCPLEVQVILQGSTKTGMFIVETMMHTDGLYYFVSLIVVYYNVLMYFLSICS